MARGMWRMATPVALLALALGACGGDDEPSRAAGERYPAQVREAFLTACERSSGGNTPVCECALEELEATMPLAEFRAVDAAMSRGEQAEPEGRRKVAAAMTSCT